MKLEQRLLLIRSASAVGVLRPARTALRWWERNYLLQRVRRKAILRAGRLQTFERPGLKMILDFEEPHDFDFYLRMKSHSGYEPGVVSIINSTLGEGGRFIDVGASSGYFTILAANRVGPSGRVFSFEPSPAALSRLSRNLAQSNLNWVRVIDAAVGDHVGVENLYLSPVEDGLNSLVRRSNYSIQVRMTTVDTLLGGEHIDLIKIDVEGGEPSVLRGMERTIESNPDLRMIVEWNPELTPSSLFTQLSKRFSVHIIDDVSGLAPPLKVTASRELPDVILNLYCVQKRADALSLAPTLSDFG